MALPVHPVVRFWRKRGPRADRDHGKQAGEVGFWHMRNGWGLAKDSGVAGKWKPGSRSEDCRAYFGEEFRNDIYYWRKAPREKGCAAPHEAALFGTRA